MVAEESAAGEAPIAFNAEHVDVVRAGTGAIAHWRSNHPNVQLTLAGADLHGLHLAEALLHGADLRGANLRGATLTKANLSGADLTEADLTKATLQNADLTGAVMHMIHAADADMTGAIAVNAVITRATMTGAILHGITLNGSRAEAADLQAANLTRARLIGLKCGHASFREAKLEDANLSQAEGEYVDFARAWMARAILEHSVFPKSDFRATHLVSANLGHARLGSTNFREAQLQHVTASSADLTECDFQQANLSHARLNSSVMHRAKLQFSDIRSTEFGGTKLNGANILDAKVNASTSMLDADVNGARIHRSALLMMREYGGLTVGDRLALEIADDAVRLRSSFSGVVGWIHVTALAVFAAPYVAFICLRWWLSEFATGNETGPTIGLALCRYIASGGRHWRTDTFEYAPWMIAAFIVGVAYNFLRGILFMKTKRLELVQLASDLPPRFSFADRVARWLPVEVTWGSFYRVGKVAFFVNAGFLMYHTVHMLTTRVAL